DLSDGKGKPARWTVLLGENGTGKTTILHSLASLELIPDLQQLGRSDAAIRGEWIPSTSRGSLRNLVSTFLRDVNQAGILHATLGRGSLLSDSPRQGVEFAQSWEFMGGGKSVWTFFDTVTTLLRCHGYGASRRFSVASLLTPEDDEPTASLFSD